MKRDEEGLKDWETEEGKTLSIRREVKKKRGRAKLKELITGFPKRMKYMNPVIHRIRRVQTAELCPETTKAKVRS